MDLQAHGSEPGPGDLPAEKPGGGRGPQAEAAAPGRRQEEAPAPAAGLRRPAVGEHAVSPRLDLLGGAGGSECLCEISQTSVSFLVVRETQADSPPDPETATSFLSVTSRSRCCWTGGSSTCARTS